MAKVKAWGRVNSHELKSIFTETVKHTDWDAGFSMLCDYDEILNFDVTTDDIYKIVEWQESIDAMIGDGRCAVIGSSDLVYDMNRVWQTLSSGRSQKICVFRQMNDALTWLGSTFQE